MRCPKCNNRIFPLRILTLSTTADFNKCKKCGSTYNREKGLQGTIIFLIMWIPHHIAFLITRSFLISGIVLLLMIVIGSIIDVLTVKLVINNYKK